MNEFRSGPRLCSVSPARDCRLSVSNTGMPGLSALVKGQSSGSCLDSRQSRESTSEHKRPESEEIERR